MANTIIIILGYNPAMNRTETRVDRTDPRNPVPICFPTDIMVQSQCPTCTSGILFEFNAATAQMLNYSSSSSYPKKVSEYYLLETTSAARANEWINSDLERDWLRDPCKLIFAFDGGSEASRSEPLTGKQAR